MRLFYFSGSLYLFTLHTMDIKKNYGLKHLNTFGIDAKAETFVEIRYTSDFKEAAEKGLLSDNVFILGGGSNVLFSGNFAGTILTLDNKEFQIVQSNDNEILVQVGAGFTWHDFVKTCVKSSWYGAENLALIPGKVGAAPVQNIGAYGVEQKDILHSVTGFDIQLNEFRTLQKEECKFAYRDSIFKRELKNRFIVSSVTYKLSKIKNLNTSYKDIHNEINKFCIEQPDIRYVFDAVCRIRRSKLPDPEKTGNAGSFFKNPVISAERYDNLLSKFPDMPFYKIDEDNIKIPAAWLIEKAGWKGKRIGDAGVYDKHALILVNYGSAGGRDIINLSEEIISSILDKFDIGLEREVSIV